MLPMVLFVFVGVFPASVVIVVPTWLRIVMVGGAVSIGLVLPLKWFLILFYGV